MDIICKRQYEVLSIYVNNVLHLRIKLLDFIGLQSWIHGEKEFFIEYYFNNDSKITTAYDDKEKWMKILNLIDEHGKVGG